MPTPGWQKKKSSIKKIKKNTWQKESPPVCRWYLSAAAAAALQISSARCAVRTPVFFFPPSFALPSLFHSLPFLCSLLFSLFFFFPSLLLFLPWKVWYKCNRGITINSVPARSRMWYACWLALSEGTFMTELVSAGPKDTLDSALVERDSYL